MLEWNCQNWHFIFWSNLQCCLLGLHIWLFLILPLFGCIGFMFISLLQCPLNFHGHSSQATYTDTSYTLGSTMFITMNKQLNISAWTFDYGCHLSGIKTKRLIRSQILLYWRKSSRQSWMCTIDHVLNRRDSKICLEEDSFFNQMEMSGNMIEKLVWLHQPPLFLQVHQFHLFGSRFCILAQFLDRLIATAVLAFHKTNLKRFQDTIVERARIFVEHMADLQKTSGEKGTWERKREKRNIDEADRFEKF